MNHQDALDQLAREIRRARRRIAVERGLRVSLPLALAAGVWALLALLGGIEALPYWLQSATAGFAAMALIALAWRIVRSWRSPTLAQARARLATDSKLDAGAFEALQDQPSRFDPLTAAFWRRERERAVAQAEKVRAGPVRPGLDQLDPYKTRYLLLIALVIALVAAGASGPERLSRAFLPDPGPLLGDRPMAIEAWAAPADYTHAAPISLSDLIGQRVATPPSVEVTVRLTGPTGAPHLVFDGAGGHRSERFARTADDAWEARMTLPGAGRLRVVRFHTRAAWRIAPAVDRAPHAAFSAPIAQLANERIVLGWRASDDYGVRRLALRVRPISPPPGLSRADPVDAEIETPAGDPREADAESELDLADHPYAGMEVEARIVAFDALGQAGVSDPMRFTLPEKVFLQPLARAAIEIRRHILAERRAYRPAARQAWRAIADGRVLSGDERIEIRDYARRPALRRAPEGIRRAVRLLDALTMAPQDGYFRDLAVFLGLRLARSELNVAQSIDDTNLAADTLWRTALRAEYGGASDARRALEEAQRQLAQALTEGAPAERVRQLVEALRRAADAYMQALVQEALRNGERTDAEDTQEQTALSNHDIDEALQEVQRLAEQGRTLDALLMLGMISTVLQNMDVNLSEQQSGEGGDQDEQMQQSMDNLAQTMGDQRALRDQTQQRQEQQSGQGGGGNQSGGQGGDELAEQQAHIREGLAQAQRMADEAGAAPSDDLNAAGEAMRRAENALRRGDLQGAEAAQSAALNNLRQGAEALAAEMHERGRAGNEGAGRNSNDSAGRDPLGRSTGANQGEGGSVVPAQSDPVRAREVYDEIRRRAEDPNRPEAEREYLRRLLNRFGDS